ncbi:MAG TPA: hypothetical protein VNX88_02000 [Terriglobales bacterium]|nr:hypothetical protein [Terriglobales bacterium]
MRSKTAIIFVLSAVIANIIACRSRGIDVTILNDGQTTIRNVEFDYPGAAFGTGTIAPGASFSYRIKPLSRGEVTLSFEQGDGKTFKQKGPTVVANEDGRLVIVVEQDAAKQWRMRVEQQ